MALSRNELMLNRADLGKWPAFALITGVVGAVVVLIGMFASATRLNFFLAYLAMFTFWANLSLGCLALLMIQYLSGGAWGVVIRRVLEAGSRMVYLIPIFFLPILFNVHGIYEWSHPEVMKVDRVLQEKAAWLNVTGWVIRQFIYFAIWLGLAYLLNKWGRLQEETGDQRYLVKLRTLSGPGMCLYALTITFAAIDWLMSLEPHWFSTMYGVLIGIGQLLGGMCLSTAAIVLLARFRPMCDLLQRRHMHDYGKLMLAFTMLWGYTNFCQLLIIWSGNIPEETVWYLGRLRGGWEYVGAIILVFHFIVPFLLLLSQGLKKNPRTIIPVAIWILMMRSIDMFYHSLPSARLHGAHGTSEVTFSALIGTLAALAGIGGFWMTLYLRELARRPLVPFNDPYLEEALEHGH